MNVSNRNFDPNIIFLRFKTSLMAKVVQIKEYG